MKNKQDELFVILGVMLGVSGVESEEDVAAIELYKRTVLRVAIRELNKAWGNMKHEKVVEEWYEISFNSSQRALREKLDEFLSDAPELSDFKDKALELWEENTTTLRDWDGDFEGVLIYSNDVTEKLIKFICEKAGVDYEKFKHLNFKLVS